MHEVQEDPREYVYMDTEVTIATRIASFPVPWGIAHNKSEGDKWPLSWITYLLLDLPLSKVGI